MDVQKIGIFLSELRKEKKSYAGRIRRTNWRYH